MAKTEKQKEYDRLYSRKYRERNPEWKKQNNIKNRELVNRLVKELYRRDKRPVYASLYLGQTIKQGKIKRESCIVCGCEKVDGHHKRYEKKYWLDVIWLCHKHHKQLHAGIIKIK